MIGVSETWLNDVTCNLCNIHGYNLLETYRSGRTGSWVGIHVRNYIYFEKRNDIVLPLFDQTANESDFIELNTNTFDNNKNKIL